MARLTLTNIPENRTFTVADPACGAGIGLIACSKEQTSEQNDRAIFIGQDIDLNCVRMSAINMTVFNLNALIIWGDSLTLEVWGAWETHRSAPLAVRLREVDKEKARSFIAPPMQKACKPASRMEQATLL